MSERYLVTYLLKLIKLKIKHNLMVVTGLSGNFSTLLFSHSLALSLCSVFGLSEGYLLALFPGDLVADLSGDLSLNLVLYSLAFFLGIILCHLLVLCLAFLSVLSMAHLFGNLVTLLSRNILAFLSWNLLTDLSGLIVALLAGNNSGDGLLNLVALSYRNWTTYRLVNSGTFFTSNIVGVWNLDGLTILFGYIYTVLLGNLVADLSRLVPALLSGFIPTLLFS